MTKLAPILGRLVVQMFDAHALTIRDIRGGEKPFVYSSGNKGPGYLMVKGLVSQRPLMEALIYQLAIKVLEQVPDIEYISGNATGGMVPAWIMSEAITKLTGRSMPYFYVRQTRKQGGYGEQITGDKNNDFFVSGRKGLVLEELVNFAQTTTNSALVQREAGYDVKHAATIVYYDHPAARTLLEQTGVTLISLLTVDEMLEVAQEHGVSRRLIESYRAYLADPKQWQLAHGFEPAP